MFLQATMLIFRGDNGVFKGLGSAPEDHLLPGKLDYFPHLCPDLSQSSGSIVKYVTQAPAGQLLSGT